MSSIRFFGFAKEQSTLPVYSLTLDKDLEEQLKPEVPKVASSSFSSFSVSRNWKLASNNGKGLNPNTECGSARRMTEDSSTWPSAQITTQRDTSMRR